MEKLINVGLIGYGMGGSLFHAPFVNNISGFSLKTIRETKPDRISHAKARYPKAKIVSDTKQILEDQSISLVVITVPNHLHFSLAREALLAGKHVVVDKPFTATSAEADELIELAEKKEKLITSFQNRRFDSDFKTVCKVIESGFLGKLVEYEAYYDRFRNFISADTWKEEPMPAGGILYNLGIHLIDQALVLFGIPEAVYADIRIQRTGGKIPDNFEIVLHYADLKVTLKAGTLVKQNDLRFRLLGDQGSFIKTGLDIQEEDLQSGFTPETKADWGAEPESIWGRINTNVNGLSIKGTIESEVGDYREFYQNIYNAIIGKESLKVKPQEARDAIRVIELAMLSHNERRIVDWTAWNRISSSL